MLARIAIAALAGCAACDYGDDRVPGASSGPMYGFSWVVEGSLSGMPRPGARRPLEQDLAFLSDQRLDLLVSLTLSPPNPDLVAAADLELLHLPVIDFTPPSPEQIRAFMERATEVIDGGGRVGVHCSAGLGRTGTMLALYFVHEGYHPDDAISYVRKLRPGSIETPSQERAIYEYYQARSAREAPAEPALEQR